jgi:Ca2+-binding EF-hand superfamily protein
MSFYALKYGEKSGRHAPLKPRGVDNRVISEVGKPQRDRVELTPQPRPSSSPPLPPPPTTLHESSPDRIPSRSTLMTVKAPTPTLAALKSSTPPVLVPLHSDPTTLGSAAAVNPVRPVPSTASTPLSRVADEKADEIFKRVDFNGNGMLSLAELDKAVIELWPSFNNKPAIMRAYKAADRNSSGFISKTEFRAFLGYLEKFSRLFEKFSIIDVNGDRRLSKQEFVAAASRIEELKDIDPSAIFDQLDTNKGGIVLFDEFCAWFADGAMGPRTNKSKQPVKIKRVAPTRILLPIQTSVSDVFKRVDFNGNGMLSLAELDKAVIELWPSFNNKPAIMRAYKAADRNGTGFISRKEFNQFLRYLVAYTNLFNAFQSFDTSGDRRLTEAEFIVGCDAIDELRRLTYAERKREFASMDTNRGGVILFDEFAARFAEQEIARAPHVGLAPLQSATDPLLCPFCAKYRDYGHVQQCRELVLQQVDLLPSSLRFAPPASPPFLAAHVEYWNASWSPAAHAALLNLFACPECPRRFIPGQAQAFATHFLTHNVSPARSAKIHGERKRAALADFSPPKKEALLQPSQFLEGTPLAELLRLERHIATLALAHEPLTVRNVSFTFPTMPLALSQSLVKQTTWSACWMQLTATSPTISQAAEQKTNEILHLVEAGASAKIPGLFNRTRSSAPEEFLTALRARPLQKASLERFLKLSRFVYKCDGDFLAFLQL